MTVTAHRLPLAELQRRAVEELAHNPTITNYEFVDGTPHLLNLYAEIQRRINYVTDMVCTLIGIDPGTFRA